MSDADSFIQEVSEEVRRDRMFGLWRRYGPFVIGGVVAIVAVSAFLAWRDSAREAAAREAGAALIGAEAGASGALRAEDFLAAADAMAAGPALVARLRAAGELATAGELDGAARLYDAIAVETATPAPLAAFAAYRAALISAETAGAAEAVARLSPLTGEEGPFRLLALEARAALRLGLGDFEAARSDVEAVLADPAGTQETQGRAALVLAAIDALAPVEAAR